MEYTTLASPDAVARVSEGLEKRGFRSIVVESGAEALEFIQKNIPAGASVMNGASVTLEQIGFVDYLKTGAHAWNNLHAAILAENDPAKRNELRKHSVTSDYYLGSIHALSETGEMVISSNSGSQLAHLVYTSPHLLLIVSTQKITRDLAGAFERIEKHVIPLEDARMKERYGYGTGQMKTVVLHGENPALKRSVTVVLVKEKLGF